MHIERIGELSKRWGIGCTQCENNLYIHGKRFHNGTSCTVNCSLQNCPQRSTAASCEVPNRSFHQNKAPLRNFLPMARLTFLQHPLRKSKGSVVRSAVVYTYSPASPPLPFPCVFLEDTRSSSAAEHSPTPEVGAAVRQRDRAKHRETQLLFWCTVHDLKRRKHLLWPYTSKCIQQVGGSSNTVHTMWPGPSTSYVVHTEIFR